MSVYKIKDLENLTGIKAHTIRIWEKRYGILKPERTENFIRTYDDKELVFLLNVSLLNKRGLKISRIAEMSSDEIISKVKANDVKIIDSFHENLLLALIELDEGLFNSTLQELINEIGLELTFSNHLIKFLEKIGIMWLVGSIIPSQEHFISNLIRQKLISEIDKLPVVNCEKTVFLFLPEHEKHEISLLFYAYFLRKNKIKTFYFGQQLPYDSLLESIKTAKPDLLVTSWTSNVNEEFVVKYFNSLTHEYKSNIYVGGSQVKTMQHKLNASINFIDSFDDLNLIVKQI